MRKNGIAELGVRQINRVFLNHAKLNLLASHPIWLKVLFNIQEWAEGHRLVCHCES